MNSLRPSFFSSLLRSLGAAGIAWLAVFFLPGIAFADAPAQSADLAAKKTDGGTLFQCSAPGAAAVYLAGDFNTWAENTNGTISDAKYKLDRPDANGLWQKSWFVALDETGAVSASRTISGQVRVPAKSGVVLFQR